MRKGALEMLVIIIIIIVSVQSLFKGGTKEKTGNDEWTDSSYFCLFIKKKFPFLLSMLFHTASTAGRQFVSQYVLDC